MSHPARLPLLTLLSLGVCLQSGFAQNRQQPKKPPSLQELKDVTVDGTVEGVQGPVLQMKASAGHPYLIALQPGYSKLGITGMAKPDFLKPGMLVSFTADVPDERRVELEEPLTDLAIITPSETNTVGLFNEDRDNKESTKFFVRGKVTSYRDGKLTVAAGGKQIVAPLPADAEIKLDSTDLSIVRQGDAIKVLGKQVQQYKSEGNNIQPGQVVGQMVDIKLQETLSAATLKKKPGGK
jgi:hypothetical protein